MIQKDFVELRASLKLTITNLKAENWDKVRTTFQALLSCPRAIKSVSNDDLCLRQSINAEEDLQASCLKWLNFIAAPGWTLANDERLSHLWEYEEELTFLRKPNEATFSSASMKRR
jgi:hypothetical protein